MVTRSSQVALVGRDAEAVHLGIGVWNGARTDAAESFPEPFEARVSGDFGRRKRELGIPDGVVISSCACQ